MIQDGVLRFTAEQLIEALEARRPWAEALDARNLRQHTKDEKEYLKTFRAACREALTWDYDQAKKHWFQVGKRNGLPPEPDCPPSYVVRIEEYLRVVRTSERYQVKPRGEWARLHHLLTYDPDEKAELC